MHLLVARDRRRAGTMAIEGGFPFSLLNKSVLMSGGIVSVHPLALSTVFGAAVPHPIFILYAWLGCAGGLSNHAGLCVLQ